MIDGSTLVRLDCISKSPVAMPYASGVAVSCGHSTVKLTPLAARVATICEFCRYWSNNALGFRAADPASIEIVAEQR